MKTQTLELIIEELAAQLAGERWYSQSLREENTKLKEELAEMKKLLHGRCETCGKSGREESDHAEL